MINRHEQELLAQDITMQNMAERHSQELLAYQITVDNLRAERDELLKDAERYLAALEAMTRKEPCDCGCPSGEAVVILKPAHYYAIAAEALNGDAAIAKEGTP